MSGDLTTRINFAVQQGTLDLAGNPVRTPAIPTIPQDCPPGLRGVISAMKQIIDVREGNNPNQSPLDHGLTLRDLVDQGLFAVNVNGNLLTGGARSAGSAVVPAGFTDSRPVLMTPPTLTALAAQGAFKSVILTWAMLAYANHAYVEIWRATSNALGAAVLIGTSYGSPTTDPAVVVGASYFYWVRAVNIAGTAGAFNAVLGTSAALLTIGSSDLGPLVVLAGNLAAGAVDLTKFGAGLEPISIVGALPAPAGYVGAHTLFLTTDKKLYRYDAATPAWTKATDGADITANSITAGQILAGTITATELAANSITATKLAANSIAVGSLAVQNGAIVNAMIANLTVDNAKIASLDGAKINAGTIVAGSIAANTITAAQIAANTITAGQIAANSITAGQIDSRGLSIKDGLGNVILAAGAPLAAANITPASGWLNSNVSLGANGALAGAGGGAVTIGGLGYTGALNATYGATWGTNIGSTPVNLASLAGSESVVSTDGAATLGFNPSFSNWAGTYPDGWSVWSGPVPTKETVTVIGSKNSVKWTTAGVEDGMARVFTFGVPLPAGTFITGSAMMFMAVNSGGGKPGYLIRLFTNAAQTTFVDTVVPITDNTVGGWQKVPFTATANGAPIYAIQFYQMASWSSMPGGNAAAGTVVVFGPFTFDVKNQITPANVSTFIAAAAIGTAQVGTLNASVITAGTITTDRLIANAATVAANSTFTSVNAAFTSVSSLSMVNDVAMPINNTGSRVTATAAIGLYLGVNAGPALAWIQVNWSLRMDAVVYDFAQSIPYLPITIGGGVIYFKARMPMLAAITPSAAAHNWGYSVSLTMYDSTNTAVACSGQWSTSAIIAAQENKV